MIINIPRIYLIINSNNDYILAMNDYPKRILAKKHKQPNIVLYFVEFETINHKIRT
jgi:hypothetical protein